MAYINGMKVISLSNAYCGVVKTLFNTQTEITRGLSIGTYGGKVITLNDTIQAGDIIKVYISGGSIYPNLQGGIIEFETYAPSTDKVCGGGMLMNSPDTFAQGLLITANVQYSEATGNSISVYAYALSSLRSDAPVDATAVFVEKVERIRKGYKSSTEAEIQSVMEEEY